MIQPSDLDPAGTTEAARLKAMLVEDIGSSEEAEALLPVIRQLRSWEFPPVTADEKGKLVDRLVQDLPQPPSARWQLHSLKWALLLLRAQISVVQTEIWAASALVILLGALVTLVAYDPRAGGLAPLAVLAPVVAAAGVALLYDSDLDRILELENATRASAQALLLARLTLVFGFNLMLSMVGSMLLAAIKAEVQLWPLVLSWLFPMAFLSAFTFFLSIITHDSVVGTAFGFGLWGLHVLLRTTAPTNIVVQLLALPGLAAPEARPWLALAAALMVAAALRIVERSRQTGDRV